MRSLLLLALASGCYMGTAFAGENTGVGDGKAGKPENEIFEMFKPLSEWAKSGTAYRRWTAQQIKDLNQSAQDILLPYYKSGLADRDTINSWVRCIASGSVCRNLPSSALKLTWGEPTYQRLYPDGSIGWVYERSDFDSNYIVHIDADRVTSWEKF